MEIQLGPDRKRGRQVDLRSDPGLHAEIFEGTAGFMRRRTSPQLADP